MIPHAKTLPPIDDDPDDSDEPVHPADEALWLLIKTEPRMRELRRQLDRLVRQVMAAVKRGERGPIDEVVSVGGELHRLACARLILRQQADEQNYN